MGEAADVARRERIAEVVDPDDRPLRGDVGCTPLRVAVMTDDEYGQREAEGAVRDEPLLRLECARRRERQQQVDDRPRVVEQALLEAQLGPAPATPYSHQLSGGQKQQVAIARAFVARPAVVICDEIVSGEDVSEHAALLELVRTMERDHATALLFISHDLAAVRPIAHYVYVIRRDRIQEEGPTDAIFDHPWNAYARRLLEAVLGPAVHDVGGRTSAA